MQLQISRVAGDAHHALDVPLAGPYKVAFQCRGMRVAQTEHISVVCPDCLGSAQELSMRFCSLSLNTDSILHVAGSGMSPS